MFIFETNNYFVAPVLDSDSQEILNIYNSNPTFLRKHIGREKVTLKWLMSEMKEMSELGFMSYKIVHKDQEQIIGFIDFKVGEESYISLIMIHDSYRYNGVGRTVYKSFEEYLLGLGVCSVRIDVVSNYDNSVLDFWTSEGFMTCSEIELNWCGYKMPAFIMKKKLVDKTL